MWFGFYEKGNLLLYEVAYWTLTEATNNKLEVRIMVLHAYSNNFANKLDYKKWDYNQNKKRMESYWHYKTSQILIPRLGHIIWNEQNYSLLQCILQGKVYGKRGPGIEGYPGYKICNNASLIQLHNWFEQHPAESMLP